MHATESASRRLVPQIWHTDWLVLKGLTAALTQEVKNLLRPGMTLVDFGCGSMPYRALVKQQGARYVGADLDTGGDVRIAPDGRLPMDNASVDALLSVQVLEHVRDLDGYCAEAHRVLTDDGLLLLSTHGNWLYHPHPEDHRRWTRTGLQADLEQRGFRVEAMTDIVGPLATTTLIRLTSFAFVLRKIPLLGPFSAKLLAMLMNVRAMAEDAITPRQIRRDNACVYLVRARKVAR